MIERYNFYWNSDEGEQLLENGGEFVKFSDHQEIVGELLGVLRDWKEYEDGHISLSWDELRANIEAAIKKAEGK